MKIQLGSVCHSITGSTMLWCNLADSPVNQGQEPTQSSLTSGQCCRNVPRETRNPRGLSWQRLGQGLPGEQEPPRGCVAGAQCPVQPPGRTQSLPRCPWLGTSLAGRAVEPTALLAVLVQVMKIEIFSIPDVQPSPCALQLTTPDILQGSFSISSPWLWGHQNGMGWDRMGPQLHCWN